MKALREAVEVGRRAQELNEIEADPRAVPTAKEPGPIEQAAQNLFEGLVRVEIGPLEDFSQLVGFEDASGTDRRHVGYLGRALLRGSSDPLDAPQRTGRAPARARRSAPHSSFVCGAAPTTT